MSRPFHRVDARTWERYPAGLSPEAKLVHAYALTNPHRNAVGFYRLPPAYVAEDTGLDVERVRGALAELQEAGLVMFDDRAILLLDNDRHDPCDNANQGAHRVALWRDGGLLSEPATLRRQCLLALADELARLVERLGPAEGKEREQEKRDRLREAAEAMRDEAESMSIGNPSGTVGEPFPNRIENTNTNANTNANHQENNPGSSSGETSYHPSFKAERADDDHPAARAEAEFAVEGVER